MPAWLAGAPWWVVAGLVIAIVVLIFKVGAWKASTDSRLGVLEEAVGEIRADIKEIRADIKEVRASIEKIFRRFPTLAVDGCSPVRLTELGKDISATADTEAWTLKHASHLMDEASGKPEFEVFEICVRYVADQYNTDSEFNRRIRAAAYEHGIDREQVRKVHEVELRDRLLALMAAKADSR